MGGPEGNIVLTGFMGTGKSTVGRALAARLGRRFVDTDSVIEQRHGPIPQIFADHGEERFRALEREVAAEVADAGDLVVATGGRMLLDPANRAVLEASGTVVCLIAEVDTLVDRLLTDGVADRPLLDTDDPAVTIRSLLDERAAAYGAFVQVPTDGRAVADIVTDVLDAITATS